MTKLKRTRSKVITKFECFDDLFSVSLQAPNPMPSLPSTRQQLRRRYLIITSLAEVIKKKKKRVLLLVSNLNNLNQD